MELNPDAMAPDPDAMAVTVYALCALASLLCTFVLWRAYRRTPVRLILWSGICFGGFALNNILLFVDLVIIPQGTDLSIWRLLPAFVGLVALVYGLIFDVEK